MDPRIKKNFFVVTITPKKQLQAARTEEELPCRQQTSERPEHGVLFSFVLCF